MLQIFPPSLSVFSDFAWDSGGVLCSVKYIILFFHCSVAVAQLLSRVQHFATPCTTVHQASLSFTVSWSLLLIQGGFRKGTGTRDQIANICWVIEKEREFQKNTTASLPMLKPLTAWITIDCGTFLKRWEYQATLNASGETCRQIKKQQLELDMEQWTGSKLGKEYIKAVYCHPAYLTYMQSSSWEMPGWMKHKTESRLLGEISITSDI